MDATERAAADYAHILDDIHGIARELAAVRAAVEGFAARLDALDELLPAARRAAAMLDNPVAAWVDMRRKADTNGGNQRAGTRAGRGRRARPAGR